MEKLNEKLRFLQQKINNGNSPISIMIIGLGSVGNYLLDYLVSNSINYPGLHIIVAGRNRDKLQQDVNIVRTAAIIRRQMHCTISVEGECDLDNIEAIADVLEKWNPDFIVNSSRVYSGLKYGSISWHNLRAYGIWTPLSIRFARNIMLAYEKAKSHAISINTSYSDAVIPWLKSAGKAYYDFGSGNLNHLIPRMKFYLADKMGIKNYNEIDITLAVSHFHDVVISKEGHSEGQNLLLAVNGELLSKENQMEVLSHCSIAMPVDQKRNMMNASSNFDIINSILVALIEKRKIKIHGPGICGEIGGYPFIIDGTQVAKAHFDISVFSMDEMRQANLSSIYLDGIKDVKNGCLYYTPELVEKVKLKSNVDLPQKVEWDDIDSVGQFIIEKIINPALG